ncbi:MAG TPA: nuclease A inhibitor family protein [Abditibacterium sp.]
MTDEKTPPPAIVLALQKATKDLQMPSETDAPFEVVFFAVEDGETEMTPAQIAKLAGAPDEIEVETRDLDEFFEEAATEEDWMDDEEKATAARFAALLEVLKTELKDAQVVVWGDAEKHVAIIGKCENGLAGVTTIVVET